MIAKVGDETIAARAVLGVSQAQRLAPAVAAQALIGDVLLGKQLERQSPAKAEYLRRVVLARRLVESLKADALAKGPPSDEEVQTFTLRHWWEIDRPESVRVAHAVVECSECEDAAGARALAEKLRSTLVGIADPEEFLKRALEVPAGQHNILAEKLQPVAADGRIVGLNARPNSQFSFGSYHQSFAKAANELQQVGELSPVVVSPSGYHVMLMMERIPEKRLTKLERTELLEQEILDARAREVERQLLDQARQESAVDVSRSLAQDTEGLLELLGRR